MFSAADRVYMLFLIAGGVVGYYALIADDSRRIKVLVVSVFLISAVTGMLGGVLILAAASTGIVGVYAAIRILNRLTP